MPISRPETSKERVLALEPRAMLDWSEILKSQKLPCMFVRAGAQGPAISGICESPAEAWSQALAILEGRFKRMYEKPARKRTGAR
jgi:hypothetical protein